MLRGSTGDVVEQYFLLLMLYGQYRWWGEKVSSNSHGGERGDATGVHCFLQILVSYRQFCYTVCQLTLVDHKHKLKNLRMENW